MSRIKRKILFAILFLIIFLAGFLIGHMELKAVYFLTTRDTPDTENGQQTFNNYLGGGLKNGVKTSIRRL
jgi:hypothetical protein